MRTVSVFRSRRIADMYLFVDKSDGLARVPEALKHRFGPPELAMELVLTPEHRLARADAGQVLLEIQENGFYLQLPPRLDVDAPP
jgi:uncharacterized protein YcgL (UPF0745 family)